MNFVLFSMLLFILFKVIKKYLNHAVLFTYVIFIIFIINLFDIYSIYNQQLQTTYIPSITSTQIQIKFLIVDIT